MHIIVLELEPTSFRGGSEPFGRTIVESMACGTSVVGSRTGGIPEILIGEFQNGLFEPGNERDLADTLSRIMNWRDNVSRELV
jgi:glycosyltransferase involved in cell wall biosynthesis